MNSIYIKVPATANEAEEDIVVPILEDFDIEAQSEFASFGELVPSITDITNILTMYATSGGTIGEGTRRINNMMNAQRWQKTNPVRISCTLHFYTKTDPAKDVIKPLNILWSLHLPYVTNGKMALPGINANNMSDVAKETGKTVSKLSESISSHRSLVSILIPGVVYLNAAMLYDIKPTYSRQVTKSGYPLWAIASCQFWGIRMATHSDFTNALNMKVSDMDSAESIVTE